MANRLIYKHDLLGRFSGYCFTPGIIILLAVIFYLFLYDIIPAHAVTNGGDAADSDNVWRYEADKVAWVSKDAFVELTGNVKLVHGSAVVSANYVKIILDRSSQNNVGQALDAESVEMIEATGNVRIELDFGTTTAETAVYDVNSKSFILTGEPAKFIGSGKNQITGSTITVDPETGTVEFKRSDQHPVEGYIFPTAGRIDEHLGKHHPMVSD